jgi:hypothetical protein
MSKNVTKANCSQERDVRIKKRLPKSISCLGVIIYQALRQSAKVFNLQTVLLNSCEGQEK